MDDKDFDDSFDSLHLANIMFGNIDKNGRFLNDRMIAQTNPSKSLMTISRGEANTHSEEKPLSKVLPTKLDGKTVHDLYPGFKSNEVLVFSKLFSNKKPIGKSNRWSILDKAQPITTERQIDCLPDDDFEARQALTRLTNVPICGRIPIASCVEKEVSISDVHSKKTDRNTEQDHAIQNTFKQAEWKNPNSDSLFDELKRVCQMHPDDSGSARNMLDYPKLISDDTSLKLIPWWHSLTLDPNDAEAQKRYRSDQIDCKRYCFTAWIATRDTPSLTEYRKKVLNLPADYLDLPYGKQLRQKWISIFPNLNDQFEDDTWLSKLILDINLVNLDHLNNSNSATNSQFVNGSSAGKVVNTLAVYDNFKRIANDESYADSSSNSAPQRFSRSALLDNQLASTSWLRNHLKHIPDAYKLNPRLFPTHLNPVFLRNFQRPYANFNSLRVITASNKINLIKRDVVVLCEYMEQYPIVLNQPGMGICIRNFARKINDDDINEDESVASQSVEYGSPMAYINKGPIIGGLSPGQRVLTVECGLFRAHAALHKLDVPYYLMSISKGKIINVYRINTAFLVGQQFPQIEIPSPNSKRLNILKRDFLQLFIYRQFLRYSNSKNALSQHNCQPKIRMEDIKRYFPYLPEASIRKKLKQCAVFNRGTVSAEQNVNQNAWYLKEDFQLPAEDELRKIITPEHCCSWYSLLTTERRLKDNGILDKSGLPVQSDNAETNKHIAEEIQSAPWNTSKTYLDSLKNRCQLKLEGSSDPTGIGLGFAFIPVYNKSLSNPSTATNVNCQQLKSTKKPASSLNKQINKNGCLKKLPSTKDIARMNSKKKPTGVDSDLRRLHLKDAKRILSKAGVNESTIRNLSRWETIHLVRAMTDKQNKLDNTKIVEILKTIKSSSSSLSTCVPATILKKFIGSKQQESDSSNNKYKQKCQKILEAQLNFLNNGTNQLTPSNSNVTKKYTDPRKRLVITRYYTDPETGKEYFINEEITSEDLINKYVHIKSTKTIDEIKSMLKVNDDSSEKPTKVNAQEITTSKSQSERGAQVKRKRRKLILPASAALTDPTGESTIAADEGTSIKFKCGACGGIGHMRTNRDCPVYVHKESSNYSSLSTATNLAIKPDSHSNATTNPDEKQQYSLKQVASTKLIISLSRQAAKSSSTLSPSVVSSISTEPVDEIHRSPQLKIPSQHTNKSPLRTLTPASFPQPTVPTNSKSPTIASSSLSSTTSDLSECSKSTKKVRKNDYLNDRPIKSSHRRRVDPLVSLSVVLETIINTIREMKEAKLFLTPVNAKDVPDYYSVIHCPITLQGIRQRIVDKYYTNREMFLRDMKLLVDNSTLYNGVDSAITFDANVLFSKCVSLLAQNEELLMVLEKQINPLLDEDDSVVMSYVLDRVFNEHILKLDNAWQFMKPVNKHKYPDYYRIVKTPIDLETIKNRITCRQYKTESQFMTDIKLLHSNSILFNGEENDYTEIAKNIIDICERQLAKSPLRSFELTEGDPIDYSYDLSKVPDPDNAVIDRCNNDDLFGEISSDDSESQTSTI
ncbi:hypothetical protein GJ496_006617 [Pomphorhynchus laevis]|nr:hypothetical protein GJ496_006617 [Pomphorhynchus laevis]